MENVLDFIVYALRCVILLFTAMLGHHEVIDNWLKDTIVGVVTLIIIILLIYIGVRATGLLKVKKSKN